MISLEKQYFRLNRFLLLAIGLWPYQKSKFAQIQFILFFSILITFIAFQLTTFVTSDCSSDLIIEVLSPAFFFICLAIKYNSFWINANTVRLLLEKLQQIYNKLENVNEIAIIEKYSNVAELYTTVLFIIGASGISGFVILSMWPFILGVLLPMNNSRSRSESYFATEYFVDQEYYFYLILLHANAAVCIGVTAMVATGTMLIMIFKCICGMFTIASYRIEKAVTIDMQKNVNKAKFCNGIICAIDIHRKAMEFSQFLVKEFEGSFFLLIASGMVSLSSTLVQVVSINNIEEIVSCLLILIALYLYMIIANYTAQEITDHNNRVFATVYNVQWYVAPIRIQKILLFLLQRGTKTFNLNLGGLFVGSLESAATLTSTSISYFTVLYSSRQK